VPEFTQFGNYEILSLLGQGGMGHVYRARQRQLHRDVALKLLAGDLTDLSIPHQRFHRELQLMTQLSHPALVKILDGGEVDGRTFIAMEFIDGEDLGVHLDRVRLMPWRKILSVVAAIADGLDYLHSQDFLHRDIKPANVFLSKDGLIKLGDFGLACRGDSKRFTATGEMVGTPLYLAPEIIAGEPHSPQSDLWALGCILYRGLTGELPIKVDSMADLVRFAANPTIRPPDSLEPGVPSAVSRLTMRLLCRDPIQRLDTAGLLKQKIQGILAHSSGSHTGLTLSAAATRPMKRSVYRLPVLAAFVLGVLGGVILSRSHDKKSSVKPSRVEPTPSSISAPATRPLTQLYLDYLADISPLMNSATAPARVAKLRRNCRIDLGSEPTAWLHWLRFSQWLESDPPGGTIPRAPSARRGPASYLELKYWISDLHHLDEKLMGGGYFFATQLDRPPPSGLLQEALRGVRTFPEDAAGWLLLGRVYDQDQRTRAARHLYAQGLRLVASADRTAWDTTLWGALARALTILRRETAGAEFLDHALRGLEPRPWLGACETLSMVDPAGLEALLATGMNAPTHPPGAYYSAAEHALYGPVPRPERGRTFWNAGLAVHPDSKLLASRLFHHHLERGDLASARSVMRYLAELGDEGLLLTYLEKAPSQNVAGADPQGLSPYHVIEVGRAHMLPFTGDSPGGATPLLGFYLLGAGVQTPAILSSCRSALKKAGATLDAWHWAAGALAADRTWFPRFLRELAPCTPTNTLLLAQALWESRCGRPGALATLASSGVPKGKPAIYAAAEVLARPFWTGARRTEATPPDVLTGPASRYLDLIREGRWSEAYAFAKIQHDNAPQHAFWVLARLWAARRQPTIWPEEARRAQAIARYLVGMFFVLQEVQRAQSSSPDRRRE
jgi:serine/threonine protein kinase